ncbi:helix-turn-helix transcriptional regulator [Evansella tamaricis]|uniref:Helix-turn-helix transcriptional regulator n=1 Tax=Evansella tamaricis TaxID=2069301 RepID=A0ABS6JHT7_9BACI|nr:helix-turn-helix transcriptional regulator [Evansella tamaricis]MBU9713202.1 helix-turn-helix transcriptional regulator [Evansella tamaricis]
MNKSNDYLYLVGLNLEQIRELLNLTQEELATKMGVSRPTIVKIEQDPSRLNKQLAFAFFVAVTYEIRVRIRKVEELDPRAYSTPETIGKFTNAISGASLMPINNLSKIAPTTLGKVGAGIGFAIAAAAGQKFAERLMKKKASEDDPRLEISWDEEKAEKMIKVVKNRIFKAHDSILDCLHLTSFDIIRFVEKVEEGETAK